MEREKENGSALPKERTLFFSTKFIRFLGGKNLLFTLIALLLLGCLIFVYDKISFVFYPIQVLFHVVILPGVLAVIAYYLLRPFLRILINWKVPRVWAIIILYLIVIGLITLLVVAVYPFLRDQFKNLIEEFPIYFKAVGENIISFLSNSSFKDIFREYNFNYEKVMTDITSNITSTVQGTFSNVAKSVASGITGFVSTLTGIVLSLVTVPFILFYLLYEGEKLPKFILKLLPPRARDEVSQVMREADKQVSSYIQGQILVSICIGVMMTIGFLIIGLDYALVLGFLAMITSVVPYLGPVIAITPAIIIALVNSPLTLVYLVIVWTIVQLIEGKLITPNIMGNRYQFTP